MKTIIKSEDEFNEFIKEFPYVSNILWKTDKYGRPTEFSPIDWTKEVVIVIDVDNHTTLIRKVKDKVITKANFAKY